MSAAPAVRREPVGEMAPDVTEFAFSEANLRTAETILAKYPANRRQSAVLPLLHLAQAQHGGWLPRAVLDYVADFLGMPRIRVYEVASFYDMFNTAPVGRIQVRVCTTTPCWLCGSDEVVRAAREVLGCEIGESSADGRFYLREFECLGACANAPVMWIDDDFYEDLDHASAKRVLEAIRRGERPVPGSARGRIASMPIEGKTTLLDVAELHPGAFERVDGPGRPDQAPVRKGRPKVQVKVHAAQVEAEGRPAEAAAETVKPGKRGKGGVADAE